MPKPWPEMDSKYWVGALRQNLFQISRPISGVNDLEELAANVDMLINVLPLTPATHGVLNFRLFECFKRPVQLINIGRGAHLVEADLLSDLHAGLIAGAMLNVVSVEPLSAESPPWDPTF